MKVGDVVRLTPYGYDIFKNEYTNRAECPPPGATAVVKAVWDIDFPNPSYLVEFFAYPGDEWETFDGEVERVTRG